MDWARFIPPIAHYLARLKARMVEQDFPPDDELFQMVEKAHAEAHALALKVHELAGGGLQASVTEPRNAQEKSPLARTPAGQGGRH